MANQKFGPQLKFYSGKAREESKRTALDVQYVESQSREPYLTVNLSIARFMPGQNVVDWEGSKITLQLGRGELTSFCEVLFGLEKSSSANFHGADSNKSFAFNSNDARGCGLTLTEAGRSLTMMLNHQQRIELGAFVLRRQAEAWVMSVSDVLAILRQSSLIKRS